MERYEHRFRAMGSPCQITLDFEDETAALAALNAAVDEVQRLEQKYSRYLPDSLTSRINQRAGSGEWLALDAETQGLINYADTLWRESDGLFDLTAGILRRAWDFQADELPSEESIEALLPLIGWQHVQVQENTIHLAQTGMEIDFGGCVKEYATDAVAAVLRQHHIEHALVNLGGDIASLGQQSDGANWLVGIRHPLERSSAITRVKLDKPCLATSGDYERCIEINGKRYGHILNPFTGWPGNGLMAVSIVAPQCLVAGSAATIAMLKPRAEALTWLEEIDLPWMAIDQELHLHGPLARKAI